MPSTALSVDRLTQAILDEICGVFGLPPDTHWRNLIRVLFERGARTFARYSVAFDQKVAEWGLEDAAHWLLTPFVEDVRVDGQEEIPAEGPLVVAANHPGTVDALAIASHIDRPDLKVVASGLTFLRGLPQTSQHLVFVPRHDAVGRMGVVRSVIHHLNEGGAVLIFPGGNIEPDPAVLPGAPESLHSWSASLDLVLRRVPQSQVVVSIVSGVLTRAALRNPLTLLVQSVRERQKIAEISQVATQLLLSNPLGLTPRVTFTRVARSGAREDYMTTVLNSARRQIEQHAARWRAAALSGNLARAR